MNSLNELADLVGTYPQGVSLKQLILALNNSTPKRTLQYRLASLVKAGVLRKEGLGRAQKYYSLHPKEDKITTVTLSPSSSSNFIPLSTEALMLQNVVSSPIQQRHYASYRRDFLDSYEPNTTFYLSKPILEQLSKIGSQVEKGRPAGTYAKKMYQRLLIDLSWNSSRLEGNTYSLLDTEKLLANGEEPLGKNKTETQMLLNHKAAIEFLVDIAEEIDINRYTILNVHALLSHNLLLNPKACGRLRNAPMRIGKSVYLPLELPQLIDEYFNKVLHKAAAIQNPFEQSFFLMIHLPYLQPFLDVNKRVSRLVGNIPFIKHNLSPLSFVDLPEKDYVQGLLAIYELNRIELFRDVFVWAYERSASLYASTLEVLGEPDPFRTRYSNLLQQIIREVVEDQQNKKKADQTIRSFTEKNIPPLDQYRFIEVVQIELDSLHEGNFARFRLRPSIFFEWQKSWH